MCFSGYLGKLKFTKEEVKNVYLTDNAIQSRADKTSCITISYGTIESLLKYFSKNCNKDIEKFDDYLQQFFDNYKKYNDDDFYSRGLKELNDPDNSDIGGGKIMPTQHLKYMQSKNAFEKIMEYIKNKKGIDDGNFEEKLKDGTEEEKMLAGLYKKSKEVQKNGLNYIN